MTRPQVLELLDPLTVGFDRILQRLTLGMDFCNGLQCIELIGLEKVHGFAESIQVLHPRFWPASFSRLAAGSSVLIVHPSESVFQNAQPQNLFLRLFPGAWGSASTSSWQKCIDICIACEYYTEFGIIPVIPRNILYRVHGEKPCIIRTCAPITRYNK